MSASRRQSGLGPLETGGRVVIIGGGPGGTATAIALLEQSRSLGRSIDVVIVEGKQFREQGHYNQCAGVLSPPIVELVEEQLHLPFPHHLTRTTITGYTLHANGRSIALDGGDDTSIALRRVQFDAYMLDAARQHGAQVLPARVTGLEMHAEGVLIFTENEPLDADVVVGAFGMDEGTAVLFRNLVGYRPPPFLSSIVTKYHPSDAGIQRFGRHIHAFLPREPKVEFGAITPKGNHLTINIAGEAVDTHLMDAFLASPPVRAVLPDFDRERLIDEQDLRYFKGCFPRGLAGQYAGDRFVMVGDAAGLVRAFKGKGITSAVQTGLRAAQVILQHGISRAAFAEYHAANRDITRDMPFGQVMRLATITAARMGLMRVVLQAARQDVHLQRALYDAVSAHRPYNQVVAEVLRPASVGALARALLADPLGFKNA